MDAAVQTWAQEGLSPSSRAEERPGLLVLDTSYTLEMIRERGLEQSVTCRDLDGFFRHVWSVHPFATMLTSPEWADRFGKPVLHPIAPRHTFIEGKVGRYPMLARWFPLNFLLSQLGLFISLLRLIRRERIGVIRVGDPLYLGLFGLALARLSGIPLVVRVNANNDKIRENTGQPVFPRLFRTAAVEKRVERYVFPRAALVAAPNQDNVDFSVSNGARPERVTIFRYGNLLDEKHLMPREERGCDTALFSRLGVEPGKYMLCVGRLQPVKFPDDAVRVLGELTPRGHDIKLVFAGDGPMHDELAELARAAGVEDRVVFSGNQDQHGLAQLNGHAAIVLSPLTGRALSEAALAAAPIVAYDLDWQSDLIETGKTGELVPFRQPEALADAAERFLRDPAYASAMGRGARQRAVEILDPETLNQHERDCYGKLLAAHR